MTPAGALAARWQAFWFRPVPIRRLAVLRVLVAAFVLVDLLLSRWRLRYGSVAAEFYEPIDVLRLLGMPRLGPEALVACYAALLVLLSLALVGLATRAALVAAAPLYVVWFASYYSYGEVSNTRTVLAIALVVLAVAPAGRALSLDAARARRAGRPFADRADPLAGWAFQVLTVLLAYMYFFAGVSKLVVTGPGWWQSGAFELGIADGGSAPALWLAEHHLWLVHLMALGALAFELLAPVLLLPGRARRWYAAVAVVFHIATLGLLRLGFLAMALVCVAVVSDLERLPPSLAARLRPAIAWGARARHA